jgi:GT2 family glycosyltransferase/glycosyltransferase involved in cell wall biosynthesis
MQIVVVGMHRSGTSMLARVLNLMGASIGRPERLGPSGPDNPKGFWEREDIRDLNDRILLAADCSWDDVFGYDASSIGSEVHAGLVGQVAATLSDIESSRPWLIKDPRLSLTLDVWGPLLEVPVYVLAIRHPLEVARSLQARNGFSLSLGVAMWEAYTRSALASIGEGRALVVDYATLLSNPAAQVESLLGSLESEGVSGLRKPASREVEAFIQQQLRHQADITGDPGFGSQIELYESLRKHHLQFVPGYRSRLDASSAAVLEIHHSLRRATKECASLQRQVAEQSSEIKRLDQQLKHLDEGSSVLISELRSSLLASEEKVEITLADFSRVRNRLLETRAETLEASRIRAQLQSDVAAAREEAARFADERIRVESELASARTELERHRHLLARLRTFITALKAQHALTQERSVEAAQARAQLEISRVANQVEYLQAALAKAADQARVSSDEAAQARARSEALARELRDAREECASARSDSRVSEGQATRSQSRIETLEATLANTRAELASSTALAEAERARAEHELQRSSALEIGLAEAEDEVARARADIRQLARWLDDVMQLADATAASARWRIGNLVCRTIEVASFRRRPRLAMLRILEVGAYFRDWWHARLASDFRSERSITVARYPALQPGTAAAAVVEHEAPSAFLPISSAGISIPPRTSGRFDVICFPVIDWHFRIQRPQHLARELAASGHRVFYVCTAPETGASEPGYEVAESPASNVFLVKLRSSLKRLPNLYRDAMSERVREDLASALDQLCSDHDVQDPVAIVDLPYWRPLAETLPGGLVVYDCMDHHAGFSTNSAAMLREEQALVERADLVITTSAWLEQEIARTRPSVLVRNGAEVKRFGTTSKVPRTNCRPVVGYIGAVSEWFDIGLVQEVARRCPEFDFEIVGAVTVIDVADASREHNIRFVGEVPYEEAADWVGRFDVCLIPFQITPLTIATNPVKVYEYLAAGKPVVSTPLPELEPMSDMVHMAADAPGFAAAVKAAVLECGNSELAESRRSWASQHDWASRARAVEAAVMGLLPKASVVVLTWNNLDFTRACLHSIEIHTVYPDWELILVDNGSTDGTPQFLLDYAADKPHVKVVLNSENLGFAAGNNIGIREATGAYVVLLNNDTYVTPGWLGSLVHHLRRQPGVGIVGPVTNNIGNEARIEISYSNMLEMKREARHWTRDKPRQLVPIRTLAFFCVAMPRRVIEEVGVLDEHFGQGFFEDDDYCRRVAKAGFQVMLAEDVFVHHHLSASFSMLDGEHRKRLFDENKEVYERKWGAWKPHEYRV